MSSHPRPSGAPLPSTAPERKVRELDPSVEAELRLQLMQLRDHAIGATAQVGELRARLQENEAELERKSTRITRLRKELEQQDAKFRATVTWRIGNLVMLPIRILRRLLRGS